jgi:hypothetical protein
MRTSGVFPTNSRTELTLHGSIRNPLNDFADLLVGRFTGKSYKQSVEHQGLPKSRIVRIPLPRLDFLLKNGDFYTNYNSKLRVAACLPCWKTRYFNGIDAQV